MSAQSIKVSSITFTDDQGNTYTIPATTVTINTPPTIVFGNTCKTSTWDATKNYSDGDAVRYENPIYKGNILCIAKKDNKGSEPVTNNLDWSKYMSYDGS